MGTQRLGKPAVAFLSGLVFALGLGLSRMTDPARVQGFLDVAGRWDPTLLFVMMGAVPTTFLLYRLANRRPRPVLAEGFSAPARSRIDGRLLAGATIFGVGWGLAGFCPGPALVSAAHGNPGVWTLVGGMVLGMFAFRLLDTAWARRGIEVRPAEPAPLGDAGGG